LGTTPASGRPPASQTGATLGTAPASESKPVWATRATSGPASASATGCASSTRPTSRRRRPQRKAGRVGRVPHGFRGTAHAISSGLVCRSVWL
jgi:hypothetical protein